MRRAEPVAGLGGALLLVSLFLPWYGPTITVAQAPDATLIVLVEATGWQAFTVIDVLLAAIAALAIAVPIVSALSSGPAKPVAAEVIASALCGFAFLLVVFRLIDSPIDNYELRYGTWLGLAGALVAWIGSFLSLKDESTPGVTTPPDVPRRPAPAPKAA